MRYVGRIGARQSSAGRTTYGLRIAGAYVNPGLLRRISLTTYRTWGGGFAKTVRRAGGRGCVRAAGKPPRPCGGTPPQRGWGLNVGY
ncbi:MAG: hypothetical protein LBM98_11925, partial [Oscillospiraceae bacterium]|nr:hypothetical protein [Oscillospiraceae bacterium]